MDGSASLRQTVTHLFDAVRFSEHAKQLEKAAQRADEKLVTELDKLETRTEEILNLVASFKDDSEPPVQELSNQLSEFLSTAKEQAEEKLKRKAKGQLAEAQRAASGERDKATKSLEAYLAADPLPIIESVVSVTLSDGHYMAHSRYECEGGMKYEFGLASQNSRLFHEELMLSRLGYELKVPVRFSKTLLKDRVPGFERLEQYLVVDAETTGSRIRVNFKREGNGANMKVVTSSLEEQGFVGIEYSTHAHAVNVTNDPSLSSYIDLESIKKALAELVREMADLAKRKVALLKVTLGAEKAIEEIDCYEMLQMVLRVLGPTYKGIVKELQAGTHDVKGQNGLSLAFIQERLKVLGELSKPVSQALGLQPVA